MGHDIHLIDSAEETAKEVLRVLSEKKLLSTDEDKGRLQFFVTDDPGRFQRMGFMFLKIEIREVKRVETIT
jgi:glutamate racemase